MTRDRKLSLVPSAERPLAPLARAEKLAAAIQFLGERHCLHPAFDRKKLRQGLLAEWRAGLQRYRP
jgi:hypothetical protein